MPDYIPPLISRVSGTDNYCLDIPGAHQTPGLAMQIYRRNGTGEGQQWWIAPSVIFHKTIIRKGSK